MEVEEQAEVNVDEVTEEDHIREREEQKTQELNENEYVL